MQSIQPLDRRPIAIGRNIKYREFEQTLFAYDIATATTFELDETAKELFLSLLRFGSIKDAIEHLSIEYEETIETIWTDCEDVLRRLLENAVIAFRDQTEGGNT